MIDTLTPAGEVQLLDLVLADLGAIVRRSRAETLTEEDFDELSNRMRARLVQVRASRRADDLPEGGLELTDAGMALLAADEVSGLLDRVPSLMRGRDVPAPGPSRMRSVTGRSSQTFGVIDGGLSA